MPVMESPRWDNWPLPTRGPERFGHCFLLRLDPAASVAALDNEEAARAAALVTRDWFWGVTLADGGAELYAPDGVRLLNFRFLLIGTALPTDYEPGVVPIAPLQPLVANRPSMAFVPALPAEGLYVHTYPSMSAVVSRIHDTSGKPLHTLKPDQHEQLQDYEARDEYNRSKLKYEKQVAEAAKQAAKLAASPGEADPAVVDAEQSLISSASASGRASDVSDIRYLLTEEMQTRFLQVRIFVEVWLDPAFHAVRPTDPAKFEQAIAQVEGIWDDWKERMLKETLEKRPQTQEWLQGVQDADGRLDDTPAAIGVPFDDYAVLPEDAIDSRIEKDHLAQPVASPMLASGIASEDVQSVPRHRLVATAVPATETVEILSRSNHGSVDVLPEERSSVHAKQEDTPTKQLPEVVARPKSSKKKLSILPKRPLAFLQGGLSVLRSALGSTKAQAARIFKTANKPAVAP